MHDFKTGDMIEVTSNFNTLDTGITKGMIGKVIEVTTLPMGVEVHEPRVAVNMRADINGHDCNGTLTTDSGWYFFPDKIKLLERKHSSIKEATRDEALEAQSHFLRNKIIAKEVRETVEDIVDEGMSVDIDRVEGGYDISLRYREV